MVQRNVLLIEAGHQAFADLVAADIPSLTGAYDAAGAAAAAQAAAASDATTKANAAQAAAIAASDTAGAAAAAQAASQPLDSDLTAIAALTTTAFGRALLELADPADNTKFLDGTGVFSTPAGGSGLTQPQVMARSLGC